MNPPNPSAAWLESAAGIRYPIPADTSWPINIGRAGAPDAPAEGIGLPHGELTKYVSRKHAGLWRDADGGWEIADAGSASGLWVNGVKAEAGRRYPLADGATVRLGNFDLTFHPGDDTGEALPDDGATKVLRGFQPTLPDAAPAAVAGGPAPTTRHFLDTRSEGQSIEIEIPMSPGVNRWTIGRALKNEDADPAIDHVSVPNLPEFTTVSRRHVMLLHDSDAAGWSAKNLSSQGSRLNGDPLSGDAPTPIVSGAKLMLGNRVFIFRVGLVKPYYNDADFEPSAAAAAAAPASGRAAGGSLEDTRELPVGSVRRMAVPDTADLPPWGRLVENRLIGPRSYPLRKRKIKIGSHPINCDIKLEEQGIEDLHATIEWHGKDCKIHSRAHDAPVRVNHAAYRVSPPLSTGTVLTLGNQEFQIEITGIPPEATGTLVVQRVRRLVIVGVFGIVAICMGTLLMARMMTPRPVTATPPTGMDADALLANVLQTQGLAGLPLIEEIRGSHEWSEEQAQALDLLGEIDRVHMSINKTPERRFRQEVDGIERKLQDGRRVFQLAGLSASMADQGWFKQIQDDFHRRRGEAYSSEWNVLLTALRDNNLANARRMLGSMSNTQQELLDQASVAVERWERVANEMRALSQADLLDGYMGAVKRERGGRYVAEQRGQLGALVDIFAAIQADPSEASDALLQSQHWPIYKQKIDLLDNTLKLLENHQTGDLAAFQTAFQALPESDRTALLKTLRNNLVRWSEWQQAYSGAGDASGKPALINELVELQLQFAQSQDPTAPVLKQIEARLKSLQTDRVAQAGALRRDAARLPEGFERIHKLLDAFRFDPTFQAETDLDAQIAKQCGLILREGRTAAAADDLAKVRARIQTYIREGLMNPENMTAVRQIENLLK